MANSRTFSRGSSSISGGGGSGNNKSNNNSTSSSSIVLASAERWASTAAHRIGTFVASNRRLVSASSVYLLAVLAVLVQHDVGVGIHGRAADVRFAETFLSALLPNPRPGGASAVNAGAGDSAGRNQVLEFTVGGETYRLDLADVLIGGEGGISAASALKQQQHQQQNAGAGVIAGGGGGDYMYDGGGGEYIIRLDPPTPGGGSYPTGQGPLVVDGLRGDSVVVHQQQERSAFSVGAGGAVADGYYYVSGPPGVEGGCDVCEEEEDDEDDDGDMFCYTYGGDEYCIDFDGDDDEEGGDGYCDGEEDDDDEDDDDENYSDGNLNEVLNGSMVLVV